MKKILFSLALASLFSCGDKPEKQEVTETKQETVELSYLSFGEEIDVEGVITASELVQKVLEGKDTVSAKVKGTIDEVCQMKGCWMDIKSSEGDYISVKFKGFNTDRFRICYCN